MSKENVERKTIGELEDILTDLETGEVTIYKQRNLIVDGMYQLIASLMMGDASYAGLQYWAIGTGTTTPATTQTTLTTEIFRKDITSGMTYIDDDNVVSVTPTNRVEISLTLASGEGNGNLTELGLFGGDATGTANSGVMVNRLTHSVITKTSGQTLSRKLRLTW